MSSLFKTELKMKTCRTCKKEKPLKDFTKHHECNDGYTNTCKECTKAQVKKRENKNKSVGLDTSLYLPI